MAPRLPLRSVAGECEGMSAMDSMRTDFPDGSLRVSDAERDRAVAELSEHFQAGRLTLEEFEDRSGRALQARTGNELAGLFADLPSGAVPAARRRAGLRPARIPVLCVIAVVAAVSLLGNIRTGHASFGWLIPVIIVGIIVRCRRTGR